MEIKEYISHNLHKERCQDKIPVSNSCSNFTLGHYNFSYYGRIDRTLPIRSFVDDVNVEALGMMKAEMKEMEDRLKRHITEAKREVVKEIQMILKNEKEIDDVGKKQYKRIVK